MTDRNSFTAVELLSRYAAGERSFVHAEIDTPALDLSDTDLEEVDFSHSFLVCTFRGANLRNSRFCNANVKTCDFSEADLTDADFTGAAIDAAEFKGATLKGARFAGASNQGHTMRDGELPTE